MKLDYTDKEFPTGLDEAYEDETPGNRPKPTPSFSLKRNVNIIKDTVIDIIDYLETEKKTLSFKIDRNDMIDYLIKGIKERFK